MAEGEVVNDKKYTSLKEKLLDIKNILSETTPGPWESSDDDPAIYTSDGCCVAFVQPHGNIRTVMRTGEQFSRADAKLIVMMRNCIDDIITEFEKTNG